MIMRYEASSVYVSLVMANEEKVHYYGSGAFLTPGSGFGMSFLWIPDPTKRIVKACFSGHQYPAAYFAM
jgi:hypothetical protein